MLPKDLDRLAVFNFPIEQFADRGARWLLENTEIVRGLLEIVSSELAARLDFSQLTHINRSFISDNLREQESDVVCSVPFRGDSETADLWIYILIEHQSTVDVSMGFLAVVLLLYDADLGCTTAGVGVKRSAETGMAVSTDSADSVLYR